MKITTPFLIAALLLTICSCSSALDQSLGRELTAEQSVAESERGESSEERPITTTVYVISRCPHCARALMSLVPLARELGDAFRLQLEYIGEIVDGQPESLHGDPEIQGNTIELCVEQHATYRQWLQFLECYHRDWHRIPQGWEECGQQNQVDLGAVTQCVEGEEGRELLIASIRRATEYGASAAPTFDVNGEITIVGNRSGNQLAQVFCSRFAEPLPPLCEVVDPLPRVPVTVVTDERCTRTECDVSAELRELRDIIWGAEVSTVTFQSRSGRAFYRAAGLKRLPAIIIGEELEDDREAWQELRFLRRGGSYYVRTLGRFEPAKGRWIPALEITATVVNDKRCPARECSSSQFERALVSVLPAIKLTHVEYQSKVGRALYSRAQKNLDGAPRRLPFVVFSETVTDDEEFYGRVSSQLEPLGDDFLFSLGNWDPTAEICANGSDDDGDGLSDCHDTDCRNTIGCRPEKRRRLELFAMSQCPFAVQVFRALQGVVDHFGRKRSKIDVRVHYIGDIDEDGGLQAMHGPDEVEENIRQVCIQHLYSKNYAALDYLACRAGNYRSREWQQCLQPPLSASAIEGCVAGELGSRLLRQSYRYAENLGMTGSPSWLLNNRYSMEARSARDIVTAFCQHNSLPECELEIEIDENAEVMTPPQGGCE